jgi:hypothetical protein
MFGARASGFPNVRQDFHQRIRHSTSGRSIFIGRRAPNRSADVLLVPRGIVRGKGGLEQGRLRSYDVGTPSRAELGEEMDGPHRIGLERMLCGIRPH